MGVTPPFPSPDAIARAERLTRERFVYDGETLEDALAPGSARRRALDAALGEIEAGRKTPSLEWRREYSLLLGLERVLSEEEPKLVDGTVLSAHQVDALSGTLTALLAGVQAPESVVAGTVDGEIDDEDELDPLIGVDAEIDADSGAEAGDDIEAYEEPDRDED